MLTCERPVVCISVYFLLWKIEISQWGQWLISHDRIKCCSAWGTLFPLGSRQTKTNHKSMLLISLTWKISCSKFPESRPTTLWSANDLLHQKVQEFLTLQTEQTNWRSRSRFENPTHLLWKTLGHFEHSATSPSLWHAQQYQSWPSSSCSWNNNFMIYIYTEVLLILFWIYSDTTFD